jgi:hypothetical protein
VTYRWIIRDFSDKTIRTSESFPTQTGAEDWLRVNWESLLDEGACSVVLKADEEILYAMGLEPA